MIEGLGTIAVISGCCTSAVNNAKRRLSRFKKFNSSLLLLFTCFLHVLQAWLLLFLNLGVPQLHLLDLLFSINLHSPFCKKPPEFIRQKHQTFQKV